MATVTLSLEQILQAVKQLESEERLEVLKALQRDRSSTQDKRKSTRLAKLRASYAAAAADGLRITKDWERQDDNLWEQLAKRTAKADKGR